MCGEFSWRPEWRRPGRRVWRGPSELAESGQPRRPDKPHASGDQTAGSHQWWLNNVSHISERDMKVMKYFHTVYCMSPHISACVHRQSCSTLNVHTCGRWRCWTVFSTRGWTETLSSLQKTSNTSLLTWRKSFSCTVTSLTHNKTLHAANHRIEHGRIISVMQLSHYLNCHNNHKNLNVCISELLLLSLLHSFCNRADDSDQEEEWDVGDRSDRRWSAGVGKTSFTSCRTH